MEDIELADGSDPARPTYNLITPGFPKDRWLQLGFFPELGDQFGSFLLTTVADRPALVPRAVIPRLATRVIFSDAMEGGRKMVGDGV